MTMMVLYGHEERAGTAHNIVGNDVSCELPWNALDVLEQRVASLYFIYI